MSRKFISTCFVITLMLLYGCSSGGNQQLEGKWILASKIVGRSPTSYWFKSNGTVIAPWEERKTALKSSGKYTFIDKNHIKIFMQRGHYSNITFFFEIVKVDKDELILRGSVQDIKMRRVK